MQTTLQAGATMWWVWNTGHTGAELQMRSGWDSAKQSTALLLPPTTGKAAT